MYHGGVCYSWIGPWLIVALELTKLIVSHISCDNSWINNNPAREPYAKACFPRDCRGHEHSISSKVQSSAPPNHNAPCRAALTARNPNFQKPLIRQTVLPARHGSTQDPRAGSCYSRFWRDSHTSVIASSCRVSIRRQHAISRFLRSRHALLATLTSSGRYRHDNVIFATKAPLVSTGKTPHRHKYNVGLSRLPRKVDKPAKAFLGNS